MQVGGDREKGGEVEQAKYEKGETAGVRDKAGRKERQDVERANEGMRERKPSIKGGEEK